MRQVGRTDTDRILQNQEDRLGAVERGAQDPQQWVNVGSGSPAPPFENGFHNIGGSAVPMRYRFLATFDPNVGASDDPTVPNGIEIQGSVGGGSIGAVIFHLLLPRYLPDGTAAWVAVQRDFDVHLAACNNVGGFVALKVRQDGAVVWVGP